MLTSVKHHLRNGTFWEAVGRKLGLRAPERKEHDHYHGDVARNYLKKRLQQESWHREQEVVQKFLSGLPDGLKVLDIAVGTGRFVDMYLGKSMEVHGIDISRDMLDAARDALGPSYERCQMVLGSADDLPYPERSFDLVVCFRFFGLIPMTMARRVLKEIQRVSRGPVIIRVPVRREGASASAAVLDVDQPVQGQLSAQELKDLFAEYGFSIGRSEAVETRPEVEFIVYLLEPQSVG